MTTGEMAAWTRRLRSILDGPTDVRRERLERMLSDLHHAYGLKFDCGDKQITVMRGWFEQRLAQTVQEWRDAV